MKLQRRWWQRRGHDSRPWGNSNKAWFHIVPMGQCWYRCRCSGSCLMRDRWGGHMMGVDEWRCREIEDCGRAPHSGWILRPLMVQSLASRSSRRTNRCIRVAVTDTVRMIIALLPPFDITRDSCQKSGSCRRELRNLNSSRTCI